MLLIAKHSIERTGKELAYAFTSSASLPGAALDASSASNAPLVRVWRQRTGGDSYALRKQISNDCG
jgi:hypothetical protein